MGLQRREGRKREEFSYGGFRATKETSVKESNLFIFLNLFCSNEMVLPVPYQKEPAECWFLNMTGSRP
jgi:hypothetical protein|tara:strand:+ start:299 stop:502 length:204 start_codon:yes stop_codon:yes gene_type:complete